MKKPVKVRIYGIQEIDGEKQEQEVMTEGQYYVQDGKHFLLYEEVLEDNQKVRTILKDSQKFIEVVKNGYLSVKMRFLEQGSFNSLYETPMGNVSLRTVTKKINRTFSQEKMLWELHYSVYMDGQYISENILGIDMEFV